MRVGLGESRRLRARGGARGLLGKPRSGLRASAGGCVRLRVPAPSWRGRVLLRAWTSGRSAPGASRGGLGRRSAAEEDGRIWWQLRAYERVPGTHGSVLGRQGYFGMSRGGWRRGRLGALGGVWARLGAAAVVRGLLGALGSVCGRLGASGGGWGRGRLAAFWCVIGRLGLARRPQQGARRAKAFGAGIGHPYMNTSTGYVLGLSVFKNSFSRSI